MFRRAGLGGRVVWALAAVLANSAAARAAVTVAASDSTPAERGRADFVCDGVDDHEELARSLSRARRGKTLIDVNPGEQREIESALDHAVEWFPGTYRLGRTLEIPDAVNCVIRAEGTTLRYEHDQGDAVVVRGMNRCRYQFGTIASTSAGAALCVRPTARMPSLMSFVDFAGLVGSRQHGEGLLLDPAEENVCVNRFTGTDVAGFDKGVFVGAAGGREGSASTMGKCDTNWFWLSYVRLCTTCVEESAQGVDCSVWEVNVDASLPDSTAIRAAGSYGKWYVIMGTFRFEKKNPAIVLAPGAQHCVFEVHPPLENFAWEDRSGVTSNVILSTSEPGVHPLTRPRAR